MRFLRASAATLFVLGILALSAGAAPAVPVHADWGRHANDRIAGQYSGSVTDSTLGTGNAVANFATTYGSVGGYFGFTFGSATYTSPASAAADFRDVQGVFVATIASVACSFAFRARYDSSSNTLDGEYKAVNGCSGESGSFSLTEQCYYDEQRDARRDNGLMHC